MDAYTDKLNEVANRAHLRASRAADITQIYTDIEADKDLTLMTAEALAPFTKSHLSSQPSDKDIAYFAAETALDLVARVLIKVAQAPIEIPLAAAEELTTTTTTQGEANQ